MTITGAMADHYVFEGRNKDMYTASLSDDLAYAITLLLTDMVPIIREAISIPNAVLGYVPGVRNLNVGQRTKLMSDFFEISMKIAGLAPLGISEEIHNTAGRLSQTLIDAIYDNK